MGVERRFAAAVAGLVLLAGCGTGSPAASSQSTSPSPTSGTTVQPSTTLPPTTTSLDDLLGLTPISAEAASLPTAEMADGGCGWTEEAWSVTLVDTVFAGRPLQVGERGMAPDALGRVVELEVVDLHVDGSARLEPGSIVRVLVTDTLLLGGYRVEVPGPDVEVVLSHDLVTVFGIMESDLVRPVRMLSTVDGALSFNGYCQHETEVLEEVADRLGDADAVAMLVRFAEANARGEGVDELSGAFEQWRREIDAASEPPSWEDEDPATRTLRPELVPPELRPSLDVYGVHYAVDDLPDGAAIGARTESGVSWSLIAGSSLPMTAPLYYLRDVDTTVEVILQPVGAVAGGADVLASIALAEVVDAGGGIEVTGSVADGSVQITALTRPEIAERLGVGVEELDGLRDTFLSG